MDNHDMDLIQELAAIQILDYCHMLRDQCGLKLERAYWGVDEKPHCPDAPYKLTLKRGPQDLPWLWFTRAEIEGYPTGRTTTSVQCRIRAALEDR